MFLILDNLRVHHAKLVQAWLAEHKEAIEVFYLPSYSRQLHPVVTQHCDGAGDRGEDALNPSLAGPARGRAS